MIRYHFHAHEIVYVTDDEDPPYPTGTFIIEAVVVNDMRMRLTYEAERNQFSLTIPITQDWDRFIQYSFNDQHEGEVKIRNDHAWMRFPQEYIFAQGNGVHNIPHLQIRSEPNLNFAATVYAFAELLGTVRTRRRDSARPAHRAGRRPERRA